MTTPPAKAGGVVTQKDKVICLECGAEMRQFTVRHLKTHGLSSEEYRKKYGIPAKQPALRPRPHQRQEQKGQKARTP